MAKFTYEQMRARQKAENAKMLPVPPEPESEIGPGDASPADTTGIDPTTLDAPALEPVAAPVESTRVPEPEPVGGFDEKRAKRTVVFNALRNSPAGVKQFAEHIRRAYNVSRNFKASDEEILRAGFRLQSQTLPDLTPDEYIKAMQNLYAGKVDKNLLDQARIDYPGHADEASLIDEMYKKKIARDEAGALSWADKAEIVARRYPELHKSPLEPEKALRLKYDTLKRKGKDVGSFDDWMHTQMAPTLAERGYTLAGGLKDAVVEQGKSVGALAAEVTTPNLLASDIELATQAGDSPAGQEAKKRLKESGVGAVNVAALAAGPLARAGLGAAEGALGVAKTAPLLAGAAEGMVAGGLQGAGQAAIEGQSLGDIVQAGATGAGVGAAIGAPLEMGAAVGAAKRAAKEAADAAAAEEAAKVAGSADLPPRVAVEPSEPRTITEIAARYRATQGASKETDVLKLAAQHDSEVRYAGLIRDFAEKNGMDPETAARLVADEAPSLTDLAAAQSRYGVSADQIAELRQMMPDHLREVPSPGPTAPSTVAAPVEPTPAVSTPTPAAAAAAPVERGVLQSDVSERLTGALNRAQGQLQKRREMIREQLSQRLAKAREVYGAVGGGLAGLRAKLSVMAGEMRKPDWEGVADEFKDIDIGTLHDAIARSGMMEGDKLTAHSGLTRLFNGTKMGAPTLSQIRALRTAFGSEFANAATQNRTVMQNWFKRGMRVLNTPRTMMTSLDLSAGMRQGYLMTSRPEYWRAWNSMRKAFGSEAVEDEVVNAIKTNPKYDVMRTSGLRFNGEKLAGEHSEQFAGSLVDRWAGVRHSQRAYDVFINKLRADMFSNVYDEMASAGVNVTDPHFRQSLAHWINTGTGRGSMALLGRDAGLLNALAFSPRLAWSRFETFNPMYYKGLHPAVRVAALKANLKTISATMSLLGVMSGSGLAAVQWDPRNSDFAKMRFGNTRIDMLGGHQQLMKLFAQMVSGKVISSTTGRMIDLNGSDAKNGWGRQGMTRLDLLTRFMEAKAAPLASLAINIARGQDFSGKPISIPNEVLTRLTPMPIQDVSDAVKESGWAGTLVAPAALVGLGVQSYGPSLPVSAGGGERQADYGAAMSIGKVLWDHLNGNTPDRDLKYVTPQLADQWVKDAAMAQVMGQQDATREKGFFESGYDQKSAIRKATARRMRNVNKLYKDLAGGNGEANRLAAEKEVLARRAAATGMDIEALKNPNVYHEVSGK